MLERIATFSEKYEFEDEFVEQSTMSDMMNVSTRREVFLGGLFGYVGFSFQCLGPRRNCGRVGHPFVVLDALDALDGDDYRGFAEVES